ncbi:MAG TPA: ABC transporter permease [Pyrinomonadaceae bacterium]|jgi:peptide/nickel transport system permease protein
MTETNAPTVEATTALDDEEAQAGWRVRVRRRARFIRRKSRLVIGVLIVSGFYLLALFADFLAPYDYRSQSRNEQLAPPTAIHFRDANGAWHFRPFIYPRSLSDHLNQRYEEQPARAFPLTLFVRGYTYKLFGLFETNVHLFGLQDAGQRDAPRISLLGTDGLGRDRLSRLLKGARFSLIVGPTGMLLASVLGIVLGCLAGYGGRTLDALLMRAADVMMALPVLVLILAARAAFPLELPPARAALLLIMIFVAVGWAEMARLARGLVMALRGREFVLAAAALGLSKTRILFRHILPNAARPLLVQMTLMLPFFLLTETALSFLGVGLQEPEASWGNMLAEASDITLLRRAPLELLSPALAIFLFVLGARLLGDGLKSKQAK